MIKILTVTSLYPNELHPRHGIFVETRLIQLIKNEDVESIVVAPVPWVPIKLPALKRFSDYSKIDKKDVRKNVVIYYPRFFSIPKIGKMFTPIFMAVSLFFAIKRIVRQGYDFDLIDAHYFYPDGVAAVIVARLLNKPVIVTARGSDINYFPQQLLPGKWIRWAMNKAERIITVSNALNERIQSFGVNSEKITTIRNGVNLELFRPEKERGKLRDKLNITGKTIISVGNLITLKGHHLIVEAIKDLEQVNLIIIGSGQEKKNLYKLVNKLELNQRVRFVDNISQQELRDYYCASDALVLASSSEGWPNVLLESMACGTPVIATNIPSVSEIVFSEDAGLVVSRDKSSIKTGIEDLLKKSISRDDTRIYAEKFSWDETSRKQILVFSEILKTRVLKGSINA